MTIPPGRREAPKTTIKIGIGLSSTRLMSPTHGTNIIRTAPYDLRKITRRLTSDVMSQVNTASKSDPNYRVVAENRRARFDYAIETDVECGIILEGSEVKSLREGGANIAESYAAVENGELWLVNSYIAPYKQAKTFQHEERRRRKLLVSRKQLSDFWNATQRKGMTLVPLVLYFNHRGMAKIKIGVAKGKKLHDKRETEARRDWSRQKSRLLKDHG